MLCADEWRTKSGKEAHMSGLISMEEAQRRGGMSWFKVRRAISAGRVRAFKVSGRLLVEAEDIRRLAEPTPVPVPPTAEREIA